MSRAGGTATTYAVVFVGGFVGGEARFLLGQAWPDPAGGFPATTFGINVGGSFLLALLLVLLAERFAAPTWVRPLLATGLLGAFTTFSTVELALSGFAADGHVALLVGYPVASVLAGLAAAGLGLLLGRRLARPATGRRES